MNTGEVSGAGSGIGMGMIGSGPRSGAAPATGDRARPAMSGERMLIRGDRGRSIADGGRTSPTADPARDGATTEPDTDDGSGTRAARVDCEPKLWLVLERGVGGTAG